MMKQCEWCGNPFPAYREKRFCGNSCAAKWRTDQPSFKKVLKDPERLKKISQAVKAAYARNPEWQKSMSRRMKDHNPMKNLSTRKKISLTLKSMGHRPTVRGGNGTGPTKAEKILLRYFPDTLCNFAIPLGKWSSGYPKNYKVDIAFPKIQFGIECDGVSHTLKEKQRQDGKKVSKLQELGWCVVRFSNKKILRDTAKVCQIVKCSILKWQATRVTALKMEK